MSAYVETAYAKSYLINRDVVFQELLPHPLLELRQLLHRAAVGLPHHGDDVHLQSSITHRHSWHQNKLKSPHSHPTIIKSTNQPK